MYDKILNTTFEVAEVREGESRGEKFGGPQDFQEFASKVAPEADAKDRQFAAFPFTPQ